MEDWTRIEGGSGSRLVKGRHYDAGEPLMGGGVDDRDGAIATPAAPRRYAAGDGDDSAVTITPSGRGGGGVVAAAAPAAHTRPLPAARGDIEMDKIFDEMRRLVALRREEEQSTRQTLTVMQSKDHLFDDEDLRVTTEVLSRQSAELNALESEFQQLQTMYQREVVDLENLIHEKEQVLRELDKSLGAISAQSSLRHHFGKKQATLHRTLQEVKLNLCERTKRSQEASAAALDAAIANGGASARPAPHHHHHHHGSSSGSSRRGRS